MRTVYKYPIEIKGVQELDMPVGASVLTVQIQRGRPCIWAIVDPEQAEINPRSFRLAGTGHPIDGDDVLCYIGTFQLSEGDLVFHLFESWHV
jgi:hypothetical protein